MKTLFYLCCVTQCPSYYYTQESNKIFKTKNKSKQFLSENSAEFSDREQKMKMLQKLWQSILQAVFVKDYIIGPVPQAEVELRVFDHFL